MYFCHSDIDECNEGTHNCGSNARCVNEPQSFSCHCDQGFSGNGIVCQGINKASFVLVSSAGVAADSVPRRTCPPGHYPLADYVPPDTIC